MYGGNQEFVQWIGRCEITVRRVRNAWTHLADVTAVPGIATQEFFDALTNQQAQDLGNIQDPQERATAANAIREAMIQETKRTQNERFPLNDNLIALLFLVQADLNEGQRERFVSSMSLRQIEMPAYTYRNVKQLFLEIFC